MALDTKGDIARAFGDIRLTPTAFLIDKQGRIIKRYLGEYDVAEFRHRGKALAAVEPRSIRPAKETARRAVFFVWLEKLARLRTPAPRRPVLFLDELLHLGRRALTSFLMAGASLLSARVTSTLA